MSDKEQVKIGFIGCGNMASAIIKGMVQTHSFEPNDIIVSNRSFEKLDSIQSDTSVRITQNNMQLCEESDIIVLSVKPQMFKDVCEPLAEINLQDKLVISIAAGINSEQIATFLKQDLAVIRAMPNTPSMISEGATGLFANNKSVKKDRIIAEKIFNSVGQTAWVEDEKQINTVTAIAGSAPAYVYLFMQAMIDQACELGFDQVDARNLVTQSFLGTAKLVQSKPEIGLDELRLAVTSPGGTTFEAIQSFNKNNFSAIVKEAVNAAYNRGVSLGEQDKK